MKMSIFLTLLITVQIFAISPPQNGKFPPAVLKALKENPPIYGNMAWSRRMKQAKIERTSKNRTLSQAQFSLPVLLGDFSDVSTTINSATMQQHLFGNNTTGSVSDYYKEVSGNSFVITGTVIGPFTAANTQSYYSAGSNGMGSFPTNSGGYVSSVVASSDATVNFSIYDNDGSDGIPNSGDDDGYVDAVIVVYPGAGADWSPGNSNLWPLMNSLGDNEITTNDAAFDGGLIKVNTYSVCPELSGSGSGSAGVPRPIGVYVHEFGHILGLPDLYDRTNESEGPDFNKSAGLGYWCLMASGSWGGDGKHGERPTHMSAWCKVEMGWITPMVLSKDSSSISAEYWKNGGDIYKIWEDKDAWSRYFLIENRQKSGLDIDIKTGGLAIYHVDENRRYGDYRFSGGPVNNDETHKMVSLEEADGLSNLDDDTNRGDEGDLFPGISNNSVFSPTSNPSSVDYDGNSTGISVWGITENGDSSISFNVTVKPVTGYVLAYDDGGISGGGWGFGTDITTYGGVKFTVPEDGKIHSIDVGIQSDNLECSFELFKGFSGSTPQESISQIGSASYLKGWHTIELTSPVSVKAGDIIFTTIKVPNRSYALSYWPNSNSTGNSYIKDEGSTSYNQLSNTELNLRVRLTSDTAVSSVILSPVLTKSSFKMVQSSKGVGLNLSLSTESKFTINLFSINGRIVKQFVKGKKLSAGEHTLNLSTAGIASGTYIVQIQTLFGIFNEKIILK